MMTLGNCRKVLAGAVLASAVLWVGTLPGQQKESGTKGKAPAGEGKTLQVKAIKLSNADPEEVRQTLMSVWPQVMAARGVRANTAAARTSDLHLAVSSRLRTLFVRGTEQQLEAVQDLVKVLDAAPGASLPESKGLSVVRLQHVKVPGKAGWENGQGWRTAQEMTYVGAPVGPAVAGRPRAGPTGARVTGKRPSLRGPDADGTDPSSLEE